MADEIFDEKLLTEKLSKLNSSQQSIESLSRWCISHRKNAKQVVEIWDRLFESAQQEQRVSFLYLANDILQISRRKGSEFVSEFWKVLPSAIKGVYESGNENCGKAASRLVDIWEERKVFGSRGRNLKIEMLGNNPYPVNAGNSLPDDTGNSNPIKVVKRDANSLRIKLAVGGFPEKILTAFQLVHEEVVDEETALNSCRNAVSCVQEIEMDVVNASAQGTVQGSDVLDYIEKQENMLEQCISKLENSAAVRVALVSQLREALQDEESKLELIRNELHVAQSQMQKAANIKLKLTSTSTPAAHLLKDEPKYSAGPAVNSLIAPPPSNPLTSFVKSISEEESKKAAAAALAAQLTSISSSAQMLTSVLSSLVAEEAASRSSGLKRPKLETPMPVSGTSNPEVVNSGYFPTPLATMTNMQPVQSPLATMTNMQPVQSTGTLSISQLIPLQAPFRPPPLAPSSDSSGSQVVQSPMTGLPFNYGTGNPLPPPFSLNTAVSYARQPMSQHPPNQQPANGGHLRSLGTGLHGQSHQPSTPPIPKQ